MKKTNGMIMVACDSDKVSDGVHTFGDMYKIRDFLFISLMRRFPDRSFRSLRHDDGTFREGMFIAGVLLPTGKQVTVHMKEDIWDLMHGLPTPDRAPHWDGHGFHDSLNRIEDWLLGEIGE